MIISSVSLLATINDTFQRSAQNLQGHPNSTDSLFPFLSFVILMLDSIEENALTTNFSFS